eukprot:CAMPEP_0119026168 /NCGR_PEP_ID=MMETSP1176-20130426/34993_1 /TAXON_ID=265551 /ORGANISM="Synedropsis recta cf, Strain CCMP1620" /LENGTH=285 /DNA_ID=CAMNT_0006981839 /DNA_START=106 /DNA_END=963 /DNA_ORIENTATION=+
MHNSTVEVVMRLPTFLTLSRRTNFSVPTKLLDFRILKRIKADLTEADVNHDGKIDFEELKLLLNKYHMFSNQQVQEIGELFYVGKAGQSVSHTTFLRGVQHVVAGNSPNENPLQFENLDDKRCFVSKRYDDTNTSGSQFYDIQREFDKALLEYMQQINLGQELGGLEGLKVATDKLYGKAMNDGRLSPFFDHASTDLDQVKQHQYNFMKIAFSKQIPRDEAFFRNIRSVHQELIESKGLNETHFDIMLSHFVSTLSELNVAQDTIDTAVEVMWLFRVCFTHDNNQ